MGVLEIGLPTVDFRAGILMGLFVLLAVRARSLSSRSWSDLSVAAFWDLEIASGGLEIRGAGCDDAAAPEASALDLL